MIINSEYDRYQGRPEQIKNRAARNAARREYEKAHGDVPSSQDIDHMVPISKGGGNNGGNLRAVSRSANRSFARNRNGGLVDQTSKSERTRSR